MRLIGPDLRARAIDQLIDLLRERVDQRPGARPDRQPARGIPRRDQPGDRLVITPASAAAPRNVPVRSYASKISNASSPFFTIALLSTRVDINTRPSTGAEGRNGGEKPWPPMRKNAPFVRYRQRGRRRDGCCSDARNLQASG